MVRSKLSGARENTLNSVAGCPKVIDRFRDAEIEHRDLTEEKENKLRRKFEKSYGEVAKATNMGAFLFSSEVAEALKIYDKKHAEEQNTFFEYADHNYAAISECLIVVVTHSKKDLMVIGVPKWLPGWPFTHRDISKAKKTV